jgi:hypothetical protein
MLRSLIDFPGERKKYGKKFKARPRKIILQLGDI